jgi:16S rRNA (cytidine1402-2'-O)-methyltransferase
VLFEAPGRVAGTLRDLAEAAGGERPAAVARELTKRHETITLGTLGELSRAADDGTIPARGEFVLVVGMTSRSISAATVPTGPASVAAASDRLAAARAEVERLVADGVARGDAARRVAVATGIPRRRLYGAGDR